jgi:hypothetical protein
MPNTLQDMRKAWEALAQFRARAVSPHHERYSFPFLSGSYFAYRKVDVLRVAAIAKSLSARPSYLDVGCGYGDFLRRVREYIPDAEGLEKDGSIFYGLQVPRPDYVRVAEAHWIDRRYDLIFVGWMEPGQDFRDPVARSTDVIVTTLDQGISLAAEFDGHGFERLAYWRTPSWEDVNTEIMNRYYTAMPEEKREQLSRLRGAHNLWYVYARNDKRATVMRALEEQVGHEQALDRYDFEAVLDECGYGYMEKLDNAASPEKLWKVEFISKI